MGAVEAPFEEIPNLFDTGGSKGLLTDMVEKIPKFTITGNENVDTLGDGVSCSVCLQVLKWLLSSQFLFSKFLVRDRHIVWVHFYYFHLFMLSCVNLPLKSKIRRNLEEGSLLFVIENDVNESCSGFLIFRISRGGRRYVVCHIVTTCFIYLVLILG